jgi:hypothetical protein
MYLKIPVGNNFPLLEDHYKISINNQLFINGTVFAIQGLLFKPK